jgi:hypothetical protein
MDTKSKYVDMMIYFLFVKGIIEVGYNVYNSGLLKEWYNTQEQDTDDDTDTTYNAGLWNFNWHIKQANDEDTIVQEDDSKVEEDTYELEKIKTHVPFLPLDGIDGYNEDIIHTNRYEETTSTHKDSKYSSPQEITPIMSAVNGIKNDEINAVEGSNVLDGVLDVPISTLIYDKDVDDIVIVPEISYPWFNSSKRGIVKMNLDHSFDTFKPFNNTSLDTVKAYDDDKLDILDTSTPNVYLYGSIDKIDEYLYKKCADEITNRNIRHKSVEFKIIPDHFKDIMSSNQKSAFTHKSSEYTNKKMIQTVNFIKTCT